MRTLLSPKALFQRAKCGSDAGFLDHGRRPRVPDTFHLQAPLSASCTTLPLLFPCLCRCLEDCLYQHFHKHLGYILTPSQSNLQHRKAVAPSGAPFPPSAEVPGHAEGEAPR